MSTNQTGHEQNVVNLGVVITRIGTFQEGYNPSRTDFTVASLTLLKTNGTSAVASVNSIYNLFKKAIAVRSLEFSTLESLITRIINAVRISGALEQTIKQAESIVRELRGKRASDKLNDEQLAAAKENGKEIRQVTLHNTTIDRKIENFNGFIQFLVTVDEYKPNEADLKITALNAKLAALIAANDNYNSLDSALEAARIVRDNLLYSKSTGLVEIALGVKLYVKSAFGATSTQYKSISDIVFSNPK